MPKLYITRYYRRDRGTKWGWRLNDSEGLEVARMNPKWHTDLEARQAFVLLFLNLSGVETATDLLADAEELDV